jgi:hypothetical protein
MLGFVDVYLNLANQLISYDLPANNNQAQVEATKLQRKAIKQSIRNGKHACACQFH